MTGNLYVYNQLASGYKMKELWGVPLQVGLDIGLILVSPIPLIESSY